MFKIDNSSYGYRTSNLRIVIYPKDHAPPHVHVIGPGCEAKLEIQTLDVRSSFGFSDKDLSKIQDYLSSRKTELMEKWNELQKD